MKLLSSCTCLLYRFENHSVRFVALVVLTGGCYPALAVVSSNCFGLDALSCGVTKYELRKMIKIKFINSVILENCPQLLFQALYASTGKVTTTVLFASTASLLSVIASALAYCIEHQKGIDDMVTVQYYLALGRAPKVSPQIAVPAKRPSSNSVDTAGLEVEEGTQRAVRPSLMRRHIDVTGRMGRSQSMTEGELSESERKKILKFRGLRMKLSQSLTELWHSMFSISFCSLTLPPLTAVLPLHDQSPAKPSRSGPRR